MSSTDSSIKTQILKTFNDQFMQFVEDIINVFPNDPDITLAKNAFIFFRKTNPKTQQIDSRIKR
jgi:meiotically up-regulated gene 157 (Mug157) protein